MLLAKQMLSCFQWSFYASNNADVRIVVTFSQHWNDCTGSGNEQLRMRHEGKICLKICCFVTKAVIVLLDLSRDRVVGLTENGVSEVVQEEMAQANHRKDTCGGNVTFGSSALIMMTVW